MSVSLERNKIIFLFGLYHLASYFQLGNMIVKLYCTCIDIRNFSSFLKCLFVATNTDRVVSYQQVLVSYSLYCEDLQVFQSDPSCFKLPLNRFSKNTVFCVKVVAEHCDMYF